ncbi:hypothetical protein GCM10009554_39130 [Kribbella koreensis]|uniref:Uncharacterized protein n=1 Tax=Kribbella koreensis TaxID=57909 RepID=A0ABP4B9A7_9ACTN
MTTTDAPRTQESFDTVKKCIKLYAMVSAITLGTVATLTFTNHQTTLFEWIRSTILLAISPLLYRLATQAATGTHSSLTRLQTLTTIMPIAIIAVDLIPNLCPTWYTTMQAISALPLIAVAVLTRKRAGA